MPIAPALFSLQDSRVLRPHNRSRSQGSAHGSTASSESGSTPSSKGAEPSYGPRVDPTSRLAPVYRSSSASQLASPTPLSTLRRPTLPVIADTPQGAPLSPISANTAMHSRPNPLAPGQLQPQRTSDTHTGKPSTPLSNPSTSTPYEPLGVVQQVGPCFDDPTFSTPLFPLFP